MSTNGQFEGVRTFDFKINRSERALQVRWLVPLLLSVSGRHWFLNKLQVPCDEGDASKATVFHLCFPLRDVFTADYYDAIEQRDAQRQLVLYYNRLFGLPDEFGLDDVWRKKPDSDIRHPGAPGRAGWSERFLAEHVSDPELRAQARSVRRMLGTEADALILMQEDLVLIECKYLSDLSMDQYNRHQMMGRTLAHRLGVRFNFGLVVNDERDPGKAQISEPFVTWSEIQRKTGA